MIPKDLAFHKKFGNPYPNVVKHFSSLNNLVDRETDILTNAKLEIIRVRLEALKCAVNASEQAINMLKDTDIALLESNANQSELEQARIYFEQKRDEALTTCSAQFAKSTQKYEAKMSRRAAKKAKRQAKSSDEENMVVDDTTDGILNMDISYNPNPNPNPNPNVSAESNINPNPNPNPNLEKNPNANPKNRKNPKRNLGNQVNVGQKPLTWQSAVEGLQKEVMEVKDLLGQLAKNEFAPARGGRHQPVQSKLGRKQHPRPTMAKPTYSEIVQGSMIPPPPVYPYPPPPMYSYPNMFPVPPPFFPGAPSAAPFGIPPHGKPPFRAKDVSGQKPGLVQKNRHPNRKWGGNQTSPQNKVSPKKNPKGNKPTRTLGAGNRQEF
jgi:hypothetical protein